VPLQASHPVSVLHIVAPGTFGGLEAVVQALAIGSGSCLIRARVAAVISEAGTDHPFLAPLRAAGVEVFPIVLPPRAYVGERAAVAQLCARLEPDVVHTHGYHADVLHGGVARRMGIPLVTTVHGFTGGGWKNRVYEGLQRRAFRRFDAVVAVSRRLAEELLRSGVPADRVHVVQNGWQPVGRPLGGPAARRALGEGAGDGNGGPRIGWVGRLSREKGPDVFLEALALLRDRPWTACMLGEGPARRALEARARALGIGCRVHWHGSVRGAESIYRAFDVFVLSSRTEGTPIALFEAMASGVPIVATAVGGVPDVVSATEAWLVAPEDPTALAAGVVAVMRDPGGACVRAQAAGARLERDFAVGPWLRRYEAIYHAVRRAPPAGRVG